MQLRLEPAHPYQLFPANNGFKSYGYPYGAPSSTTAFPFINSYQQAHDALMNSLPMMNNAPGATKRPSAFEPIMASFQSLPPRVETKPVCSSVLPELSDFAASLVYLMWHARKKMSVQASNRRQPILVDASKPNPAFKKFCLQLLTATQLSESAVHLALKYVAVLLRSNLDIEGEEGSEYRLFTVALMLANKFLDDSTYTNKTWSEVSGLTLKDLNMMEAEFMEIIRYDLFVRMEQFEEWSRALEDCRDAVKRMTFEGYRLRDELVRSVLLQLGLCEGSNKMEIASQYCENPSTQDIRNELATKFATLRVNNEDRARQMCLHAIINGQDAATDVYNSFPHRPHRQTAPPPPISRYNSSFNPFMSPKARSRHRLSAFSGLPSPDASKRRRSSQHLSLPPLPKPSHTSAYPSLYQPPNYMQPPVNFNQAYTTRKSDILPPPGFTESDRLAVRITEPSLQPRAPPSYKQEFYPSGFATATTHDADWRYEHRPFSSFSSAVPF